MKTVFRLSKFEAANRQLDRAIRMLFEEDDPVCTHTLAGAASILLADLVEHHKPSETWEQKAREDNLLGTQAFFKIARKAQNFLKHARNDPDGVLEFNPSDTDALLTLAVYNAAELSPLSPIAEVFQLWSLALLCSDDMAKIEPFSDATAYFGRLPKMTRTEQLAAGRRGLLEFAASET